MSNRSRIDLRDWYFETDGKSELALPWSILAVCFCHLLQPCFICYFL